MTDGTPARDECLTPETAEALLRGELATAAAEAVWAHVEHCQACRDEIAQRQADNELLTDLRDAHRARIDDEPASTTRQHEGLAFSPAEIDGFEILEELHRGGQGVVYKAQQASPNRLVALKVLREDVDTSLRDRARFEREIELAASLRHPNIVTVYETGIAAGRRYFAMEYVEGRSLDAYVVEQTLTVREKVSLLLNLCRTVQAAHQRGVVHRDLKPGNVIVDDLGEPHVLDFGIAVPAGPPSAQDRKITVVGEFLGTVAYASPEQTGGNPHGVDVRSDVYSLGVLGYEILTGRLPYELSDDLGESIRRIRESSPYPPSQIDPRIDDDLETILLTAMAKDVERRYASAEAFCRDLEHYLAEEPIEAKRDSVWYVLRKSARKHRVVVGLIIAGFLLITTFAVTMAMMYQREERAARRAERTQRFLQNTLASVNAWTLGPDATLFEVLANAERTMHAELVNQPDIEAELRYTIGLTFASVRRDDLARGQLQAAFEYYSEHPDAHQESLAVCMANLGRIDRNVAQLRRAVALQEGFHGEDSIEAQLVRLDLAYALIHRGSPGFQQAETIVLDVEQDLLGRYGEAHRYVSRVLHLQAWLRSRQERPEDAVELFRRAIQVYHDQAIPDVYAPELYEHYTELLISLGHTADADALLAEAMQVLPPVFGRHWLTRLQWRRGRLQFDAGQTQAAEASYRRTLALHCTRSIDREPAMATELQGFASRLYDRKDGGDASLYGEVLQVLWRLGEPDSSTLAPYACDLAELLLAQDERDAACELVQQTETLAERHSPIAGDAIGRLRELSERCEHARDGSTHLNDADTEGTE